MPAPYDGPMVLSHDAHRDTRARTFVAICYVHFSLYSLVCSLTIPLLLTDWSPDDAIQKFLPFVTCAAAGCLYSFGFLFPVGRRKTPVWGTMIALVALFVWSLAATIVRYKGNKEYQIFIGFGQYGYHRTYRDSGWPAAVGMGFAYSVLCFCLLLYMSLYTLHYYGLSGFRFPFALPSGQPRIATLPKRARRDSSARIARVVLLIWTLLAGFALLVEAGVQIQRASKLKPGMWAMMANEIPIFRAFTAASFAVRILVVIVVCAMLYFSYSRPNSVFTHVWVELAVLTGLLVWLTVLAAIFTDAGIKTGIDLLATTDYWVEAVFVALLVFFEFFYTLLVHTKTGWRKPFAASSHHSDDVVEMAAVFKQEERRQKASERSEALDGKAPLVEPFEMASTLESYPSKDKGRLSTEQSGFHDEYGLPPSSAGGSSFDGKHRWHDAMPSPAYESSGHPSTQIVPRYSPADSALLPTASKWTNSNGYGSRGGMPSDFKDAKERMELPIIAEAVTRSVQAQTDTKLRKEQAEMSLIADAVTRVPESQDEGYQAPPAWEASKI